MQRERKFSTFISLLILIPVFSLSTPSKPTSPTDVSSATSEALIAEDDVSTCLLQDQNKIPADEYHWLYFPLQAQELQTDIPFVYLAGKLITNGVVDASNCLDGGVYRDGAATTCGLSQSLSRVLELQNMYDDEIINAGSQIGVPPVMLKQQIRYESQFWPGQFDAIHYGLGHLTPWGASTALMWNRDLYQEVCQTVYGENCTGPYVQNANVFGDVLVQALLDFVNADCESCLLTIDTVKAEASIRLLAMIDLAHCYQTAQVIYNLTGEHSSESVDYATIWKLAMYNYNAGPNCLYTALEATLRETTNKIEWEIFAENVDEFGCKFGVKYVDQITDEYYNFTP